MAAKFIVVVSEDGDARRGEITVTDNPRTAEHLVETLLAAGFPQERIHLFSGEPTPMEVGMRPVVSLADNGAAPARAAAAIEIAPAPVEAATAEQPAAVGASSRAESRWGDGDDEDVPYVRDGVRFSSLFRAS